mmetsp:Transcript_18202/g.27028  ORF Transcript_18202/g.27028 Transcript_18202/m.27028 type:complete len:261 (+) Transcript_18202:28-810(+)
MFNNRFHINLSSQGVVEGSKQKLVVAGLRAENLASLSLTFRIAHFSSNHGKIGFDHLPNKLIERSLGYPTNLLLGLGGVSEQELDFGRTEVSGIDLDKDTRFVLSINSDLINGSGGSNPLDGCSNNLEGLLDKLTDSVRLSSCKNVVIGFVLLHHHPHTFDVITGMSPITLGINVTQVQGLILLLHNTSNTCRNLTGHEGAATTGRFVVEKNTIRQVHSVGLTVVDQDPEGVLLGHSVWRSGVERSRLALWNFLDLSVKL